MKINLLKIVVLAFAPLALRTVLYLTAFKVRSIEITLLNCIIIAGAGYLVSIVPLPLPFGLYRVLSIGAAMFLITQYTKAELFPDVILIPLVVELSSAFLTDYVLIPLTL
jgi:hypothetical protein